MKFKLFVILIIFTFNNIVLAQHDLIFKADFEYPTQTLNDTGITWGGDYSIGNNDTCISDVSAPQDCDHGRDATHNDDSDGYGGFSFTKLDANGIPLIDQSVDFSTEPWSCVKDNITGLVWEVKTDDAGIHDKDNTYRWGGLTAIGRNHPERRGDYNDDWNPLVDDSNNEKLCGYDDWRVPTVAEFLSILNKGTFNPSIDTNYFPNTRSAEFWSSSPAARYDFFAWTANFGGGFDGFGDRNSYLRVRLVRGFGE